MAEEKKTKTEKTTEKKTENKETNKKKTVEKKPTEKKSTEKKTAGKKAAEKKTDEKKTAAKKTEVKKTTDKNVPAEKSEAALHPTLQKKKEAREAKAARKAANKVEEKKNRPNNILLAILIFGILVGMFAFVGGYNYFKKPATIEKFVKDNNMEEMYGNFQYDENTQVKMKAEGNTVKVVLRVAEDAPKDAVEQFKGEDGTKKLKDIGAYFLTTFKPQTRAFNATVKVAAKQGDETINYVKMSYKEAKQFAEDLVEESKKEAEEASEAEAETEAEATSGAESQTETEATSEAESKAETEAASEKETEAASEPEKEGN